MGGYIKKPEDIEKRSFEIITEELGEKIKKFTEEELPIVKRVIHTTADFEYADLIEFLGNPIGSAKKVLSNEIKEKDSVTAELVDGKIKFVVK